MNIAFVINKNYIGQFKVTFYSLAQSNQGAKIAVHLLQSGLNEEDKQDLCKFTEGFGAPITFYEINQTAFEGLPKMREDDSYSAYYKVLLPYLLSHLDKVLYLDCDIIVKGNLLPLYESDSRTFLSCGADFKFNKKRGEHIRKITGSKEAVYFNSGVMLFDFSHREELMPQERVFAYIREHAQEIVWHDQDIYNHFFAGKCTLFEEKYNYLTVQKSLLDAVFRFGAKKAVVVHYANWKPWNENYIGKCYKLYQKTYRRCREVTEISFLKKRKLSSRLKLIWGYIKRLGA